MGTIRTTLIALTAVAAIAAVSCRNPGPLYEAEGSVENPLDLGDPGAAPLVYYGEVDTTGSVYQVDVVPVTLHAPGYHVTLTDLLDDADLFALYDHIGNYVYSCTASKTADEQLDAYPTDTILYIVVDGEHTERGTTFTLTITKN